MRHTHPSTLFHGTLAAMVWALASTGALAQQAAVPVASSVPLVTSPRAEGLQARLQSRFAIADANHDGQLTREEANGRMPWVHKHFDAIDSARAGSVTLAQIQAFAAQQTARRRAQAQ